jgi:glutamate N-acetyltransferase / amino-acid N-acetyltransferase
MPHAPDGFVLAGLHCGIKTKSQVEDMTLVYCQGPAAAAGVYTQNLFCAAPVQWNRQRTPSARIRAIVANSGNANACTGERGLEDARQMARIAAEACGLEEDQVLVLSTGVIGEPLPMQKVATGIRSAQQRLAADEAAYFSAARGITTTDIAHKVADAHVALPGGAKVYITGMAKGAGMIGPRMATMLCILLTDAPLTAGDAQAALADAADNSFNCISVEGHMSTNDTVLLMASGRAANTPLAGDDLHVFRRHLTDVCIELARMIPNDGEGATHLITVEVQGCRTRDDARRIAETVAASPLVKCAITGGGPYWGRVVSAAGYAGVPLNPKRVKASINGILMYQDGEPVAFDGPAASRAIRESRETHILLQFAEGTEGIRFWTSDLTVEYVQFNAHYLS